MPSRTDNTLPASDSADIHLINPTPEEQLAVWNLNSTAWAGALTKEVYLQREAYLMTVPLARDGGITHWILVSKHLPPNQRPMLGSCESLRKRALVTQKDGVVTEVITHGIGSVFCNPEYRGRKYASRMMRELAEKLRTWQALEQQKECLFSVLWSDIGKEYYAGHGWHPFPSSHIEFPPSSTTNSTSSAKVLFSKDLGALCETDEILLRKSLANTRDGKTHVAIIPDNDQMQWHHMREEFLCSHIFGKGKFPVIKGAISGEPGERIWAIWTRSFYGPLSPTSGNTLHILRLVMEGETSHSSFSSRNGGPAYDEARLKKQAEILKDILAIAQAQAEEWNLLHVELWNPSPLVQVLVEKTGLIHSQIERDKESVASLMWYGEGSGTADEVDWVGNEKYGWC